MDNGSNLERLRELSLKLEEAETLLERQNKYLRTIFDVAISALIVWDWNGIIIDWNPMAEKIFGYSSKEAIGQNIFDLIAPPKLRDQYKRDIMLWRETGETHGNPGELTTTQVVNSDGRLIPVESATLPMTLDTETLLVTFVRDITEKELLRGKEAYFSDLIRSLEHDLDFNIRMVTSVIKGLEEVRKRLKANVEKTEGRNE